LFEEQIVLILVEFAYEYHGYRISGYDDAWDVTWGGVNNYAQHSGIGTTPKKQAQNYMNIVTGQRPTGIYK